MKYSSLILIFALSLTAVGCGSSFDSNNDVRRIAPPSGDSDMGSTDRFRWVQVERLARPAVNEGLVLSNDFLNAFNSIPPSADLSEAAGPVVEQALTVLTVVNQIGVNLDLRDGSEDEFSPLETGLAFLPDVMRIDVANAGGVPNGTDGSPTHVSEVGYLSCVNSTYLDGVTNNESGPLLCGGRKIRDDVVDITLTLLVTGQDTDGDLAALGLTDETGNTAYAVSDRLKFGDQGQDPVLDVFPFLAKPH